MTSPPSTTAAAPPDTGGESTRLPTRDQLTLVWPDHVLPRLKGMAKARFAAGRFIEGDGTAAVLALPNGPHRDACEPLRPQVEEALAAHFGRRVPVQLVVDGAAPGADGGPPDPDAALEERYDPSELVDAPEEGANPIERVAQAFPGAKLLEDDGRL